MAAEENPWKYPPSTPNTPPGYLKVSEQPPHEIYWEEHGNPKGDPVIFLHGGPGAGVGDKSARFFDPQHFRIILFDQRGAKRSKPYASLDANTTPELIKDIDKLRHALGIKGKAHLFGGSWGSTLALAYAIAHPEKVKSMTLRGIFLCRKPDLDVFYQGDASDLGNPRLMGTGRFFPGEWKKFVEIVPKEMRRDMIAAYRQLLNSSDKTLREEAAKRWSQWEAATMHLETNQKEIDDFGDLSHAVAFVNIENHYFMHGAFLGGTNRNQNYIVENVAKIRNIPTQIVQGRYDMVCPRNQADDLVNAWIAVQSDEKKRPVLHILDNAGHSWSEPPIVRKLTDLTDSLRLLGTDKPTAV